MAIDKDGFIITTLERISDKLDRHDEKLEGVQQDVNKFVVVFEKMANIESKHDEHYKSLLDRMDDSSKRTHHRIDGVEKHINKITDRQEKTGCPMYRTALAKYDAVVETSTRDRKVLREEVDVIKKRPMQIWDKVVTVIIVAIMLAGFKALGS